MTFEIISSIELTLSAAVVIAIVAFLVGRTNRARIFGAMALGIWFALVVVLGATEVLTHEHGIGVAGLGASIVFPTAILCLVAACSKSIRGALLAAPLWLLVVGHGVRLLGVSFLLLYANGRLPAPFAPIAGWGDIMVGLSALPVAWIARVASRGARRGVFWWNVVGMLDLLAAVGLGVASSPGLLHLIVREPTSALMASLPWVLIPGFLVPLLMSLHIATFYRLYMDRVAGAKCSIGRGGAARESPRCSSAV